MTSLQKKIRSLCQSQKAVILAHHYTLPEVQEVSDFVGDSLELSLQSKKVRPQKIIFCGVSFMAETTKILNPSSRVFMPDPSAGCPMAEMISPQEVKNLRVQHPNGLVVCYVNTPANVKAESDVCCTSGNAVRVVQSLPSSQPIIFIPDQHLGRWVEEQLQRKLILWKGFCPTHQLISLPELEKIKSQHPKAEILVHPENPHEICQKADVVGSTSKILAYARTSSSSEFIIGTENGILYGLQKENPQKTFYPASPKSICPTMKKTTAEKILRCLEEEGFEVLVEEPIASRARASIEKMLAI